MPQKLDITGRLHKRMLEIVGTALPLIASSMDDADLAGIAHLRTEMVEAFDAYSRHVHQLRDRVVAGEMPGQAGAIEMLVASCSSLQEAYGSFRDRWAHREAMENWHEYRLSAIVMMKQVRNHIQKADAWRAANLALAA